MAGMLKLYHARWLRPIRVGCASLLPRKAIAVPLVPIDLSQGEQHSDAYRAITVWKGDQVRPRYAMLRALVQGPEAANQTHAGDRRRQTGKNCTYLSPSIRSCPRELKYYDATPPVMDVIKNKRSHPE